MEPATLITDLGSDRVTRRGDRIVIDSRADMTDWVVRNYRRPAVVFEGRRYFVARKDVLGGGRIRYLLEPWPHNFSDLPGRTIHYDERYVRTRDAALKNLRKAAALRPFLTMLMPLIGFLFSGTKATIEARFGISARKTTWYSLCLELVCFLALGVLILAFAVANLYFLALAPSFVSVPALACSVGGALFLLLDLLIRYGSVLREEDIPYGLCEWLIRRPRRA